MEKFARENNLTRIASITLQVGELSPVIPRYLEECFPAAVDASALLRDTALKIETLRADCICNVCGNVFHAVGKKNACPSCGYADTEIMSGTEFLIKEIEAC